MTARRPRVLHLAYEDHLAPGSGGGAVRTREINERLADRFAIDQVFAPYPGAAARRDGDLGHVHMGFSRGGKFTRQIGYFAKLPGFVRKVSRDYDLVVEDFGAPFGSVGVPRFSGTPTIGIVQWLFAAEKAQQYHLPFRAVETFGVRSHSRFIAVSQGIADELLERNAAAHVDVIANGLPDDALADPPSAERRDILFLGRLDVAHKGLDLLLDAFAQIRDNITQDLVLAGEGDGEQWLRDEVARRGLGARVRFAGRIAEAQRFDALAACDVVAMPSRYESFGMVAAEAAAVGTPVVAFDIACLRDLVPADQRVPAFDVGAYARVLTSLCNDARAREQAAHSLPSTVAHLSWDALADRQAEVYLDAIGAAA